MFTILGYCYGPCELRETRVLKCSVLAAFLQSMSQVKCGEMHHEALSEVLLRELFIKHVCPGSATNKNKQEEEDPDLSLEAAIPSHPN